MKRNREAIFEVPEGISPKIRRLLERMLERDFRKRFRTAMDM